MAYDPELLTQDFIPFDDVVKTPTYQEGDNDTRVSKFDNWSNYSLDFHKKKLAEAPDEEKPLRQKELDTQTSLINEKKEAVYNKYDLKYQVSKMGAGELIAALRDPNKLLEEGHKPELIQGLRAEVEKEFAPILAQSQAGTLSENEAAKALWEEPNLVDKVANFANQVLPMAAIMAAKAVEGGANLLRKPVLPANEVKDWDTFGKNMGNVLLEKVAGAAKGVSEWVGKEAPLDPRFSGDTSAFISGAAQMPGNLALGLAGAPVNATSNYLQMFQENLDTYEPEISKARYAEEIKSGKTSASTPFKQWQSLLSKDDKEDIRAEAATKAMVVAMPQAALETVSDALLLKHIPLPAAIKQKLPAFLRNAAPKTFIGGKIVGQFLAKTGMEGVTEGAQELAKNVGSAINTGDWSGENLTQGLRGATIGGLAGGGFATALTLPNTFRTEKALDWALGVSTGRLDSDAQKDIAILRNPEIDKSSPEYQEADSRFSARNNTDRQHQFDLATIASPTEDQSPSEIKAAKARVSAREDEAHWVLSKLESEDADPIRAQRYQAKTAAQKDFQDSIAQHLQKSAVDWDPSGEKLRARAQEIEDSFSKVEANAKAIGSNLDVAAAKKMALDQLLGTQDKQAQAAEDSFLDALGSSDSAGPLRAKFARQELMRLYPEQNAHLTPWFKDDSTVVEMLNARENEEIDDDTNLDSWLASPEGIKSTTSDKKTDTATDEKPKGLMTVGQRRDAFRLAEDNAEASGDENQKKEFARLKEDVDFWHSVLSDTESNEQDKAEAKAKLPALEGSLLDLATAPVEEKSLNQAANDQNQPPSQASVSNQEVSPTSPESSRTGEGTPFTVVRTMDGGETTQTEQDYINESREIVKSLTGRGEIKMTPEAALQNVEAVRQEIESAPDLTPEQKQQWSSHFDNIPLVVQQLNSTGTTLPTSEPVSETTTGAPIPIAQPTPVRMGGVTGDLTRTESGEAVFSPTDNSPETVLRVKETSIEKDPATLTVEDFESGDGTPLVSETDKQFSVLPQNERLVRPFFRSEPAPLSPAEQPKRGETQNEIQQTESLREGQSQPLRQGQSSSSSAEGQSSSLQGQEITYQTTAQDGQTVKSTGSYPVDAGSTPAPATPEEAQLRAIRAALPKPPSAVVTEQAATPAPTRTRSDVESSPEGVAIVEKYDRHYEMVSDFELNLGDATRAQAVALTNKLLKAGAITESDAAEALRLAKDKGYDREDAVSEATSVLQGAVEFRKDQQIDELLATPVAEAATPPSSSAIDTATITADVQANPDAHRRIQGRKREVSREGAVAILTQLPESFTKQDAINIAKDAGMSRERLTKLAALRNDPNSVSSILSGAMDAELGLFDRNAEPTEDAAVPPAIPETSAEVSEKDTTKPAVTPNQSPADRWVYTGMAAFEEKLRGLKGAKYDQLRAALDSDTGRADLQRKLAGIFNIKVQKTLKAGGVLDPVVLEDTTEKILYGNVSQNDPGSITKNVMGDLLSNLEQTGDPFRVGSGVAYDASGRVRNQSKPAREIQSRRDRGLVSESTDGDGNLVNPRSETPSGVTMLGTTDTAPERAANKELAQEREHQAMQDGFHEVIEGLVKRGKGSYYDVTLAVAHIFEKAHGIGVADPVALGWKSPDSKGRVKKTVLKTLTPLSGEINKNLIRAMRDHLDKAIRLNREEGLLDSPAVSMDLASILKANIYESLISEDKFKPAIQKAREQKSTAPLMPVLAEIGRNDVANIQSVVQNVLNNGKPFASHRDITSLTQSDMQAVLDSGMLPERVQETLQALVDLNGDGMALLRNSTNEGWRRWSEILGEQIGNRAPVQVMFNLALDPSVTGQGLWKEGTNTVHISPFLTREPGLMESTMLHEMMHPIWDWKVTAFQRGDFSQLNQKELAALSELSGLFDLVNKEAQSRLSTITDPAALSKAQRDLLGASNLREFLNEAINHKPFQDFLAELKDPDAKGKGGLLRRIVNAILRLIRGGDVAVDSILQRSFELSLDLANYTDRELPIAERNKTQIDYFKSLEAERGRPLTLPEYERASVDFALKYPQPRIANTPAEASRLAQETLVPDELDAFNEYQRTKNEPVLASEMVTQAQEVYEAIKANGGITVDVWNGSQPSSGIVVAPFKETETTFSLNEFTASDVKDYMEKFRPLLEVSGMHLGGWVDNDTVYLDVSIVADNEVTATALAQDGNQLATFNLENFTQLNTPDLLAKYGGESGEVSRLRSETRYKDLRGALEQALRRAMGGVQRTDSPNVSGQGAVQERTSPELDLVETLTGETPTAEEAAKILESSPVPTYYDNLTNKGTDPITGIRTAIGRAAKRGNGAGRNAAQGNEGPLVRGSDFPDEIRRGDRETHQELERARSGINEALGGSLPFQSLELIKQLTGKATAPEGSELAQTIDALRNKIPVLPNNALEGLKQLSEGMSSKVFVDTKNDSAYKLLSVSDKGSVGGTFPKDIRIRAADDTVVIASEKNPSLLEFLRAVAISNVQGNAVFTEIAGVTEDGDVILKQPYIKGLKPTDNFDNPEDFREALRDLGLSMLSDIGAVSAVGKVGTRYALFDDLHGENIMRDKNGRAQLVDALATRLLSADEYTSVSPYLKDPEVLQSVAVSYEKAKGERLETLLDKAVPEAPQTPFLQVNDFEQAKASLANLVLGPNSSIKGRSGIVVNFQYPDYSTARFLLNPERVRGESPIKPTKQEALEARVTHALTDDFDRATPSANKVASAPMVVQTIKQADFVTSRQFDKSPVNTFVKLYDDPSSPTGLRWHFVETFSTEGDFITQYSSTDRKPTGRAMGSVITRIGDSAPKTPNVAPAVIQEEAPAPEPVDIEAEQTRILDELDALAQKRDRLLRDQNYKAAGEVYEQIRELEDKFDSSSVAASAPVPFTPMPMSALDVLYKDSESLPKPDKKIKNSAVATTLAEAALKYWGFQLNSSNITPEIEQILVSNGVEEFISALQASGKNAGDWYSTAIEVAMGVAGVIHPEISDVEIAKSIPAFASAKEPDKAAQLVMRIALAVTSQNLNVNQNAGYAEEQYAIFSSTGKFDSSKIYGEKAESISGNLRLANELITRLGFEGAEDFIKADFSVDALQKKASAILGRSVKIAGKLDDSINGAALFGPKIGQGFLQNLMGRFTPVTIDLWMRRTWGRWTGDVVGDGVTDERMAKLLDSARDAGLQLPEDLRTLRTVERKRQNGNPFKTMSSSVSDRLETDPEFRKSVENLAFEFNSKGQAEYRLSGQPVTPEQAAAIAKYNTPEWKAAQKKAYLAAVERGEEKEAKKIQEEAERARTKFVRDQQRVKEQLDQTWKDLSAAGKKPRMPKADWVAAQHQEAGRTEVLVKEVRKFLKPEWSRNAKVIVADLNPIDIPSPQDRRVISRVVNKIREELSNKGYTATNADVQAVLWYPEKDVWAKLRGEEESNLKLSYDDEFITIAEGRGLGDQARTLAERIRADRAARTSGPNDLRPVGRIDQATDGVKATETLASAPVTPAQALPTGFKQTTATAKDRRETTALSRVMIDPEYQGVRDALEGKQYISYDANETTAKANEFLNSPDFNGNLEAAVLSAGSRLPIEQIVMVKGLAIQRAQKAANAARATMLDPSLPIQVRNNASVISTQYQKISDRITDDLMEMGSLAGQELRAFRLLADALVPRTWVKKYKQPIIKAQREKLTNDPVFKDMMARIAIAQKNAADSTTTRMKKALAMAAAKFVKDTSVEEVTAYEDFARAMASGMPVKDDVMKAAIEMVVVSGMETVKKSVAPNEQVDPSFLKQWEDKLRSIASEQLNGIIESRLQGGKVDAEAQADLTEEQKAEAYEQKIMDAWRDFSDFPLAEMVFNLARTTIVASDSPYASLVQKAQFDPAKIKRLQQAVKLSINTKDEIRKSLGDKNMSVESLKLRLQEANPNLTENELGALANAVQEVYNSEVQRASVAALQGIIKAGNRETRKIVDAPMIAKLLPLVNMGAFQDEAVYNALADKFNLPTWTQESADKIEALANGVQALPEGSIQRGEAGQQMLLEILQENIKDSRGGKRVQHYSQIAAALWTAGVLSGPSTQIVNAAGTTASVFLESLSEATGHFWEAKKRGVSTGQATEYYKDIARAWLFAFGKDANNVSLRAMNEVHTGLTRGTTKFKSEKQEDLSLLELFKFDPRVAIPGNTLMEAITTGQWKAVVPALGDLGLGVAKTMAERVVTGDVKGALRDYVATRKMVGRLMLASDATNSFSASTIKQMMLKRTLMQKAGLSESEVNRQMKEIQKGGDATIVNAAKAQAEQEAAEGQFGQSGSAQNISKARRVEQLIEQMTYGNEVIEGGRNYAGEITFNGEPSGLIGLVMMETFGNLNKHLGLVAKPINPFPKTISNLLNNSLNYTIYGSFRAYGKNFGSFLPESNEYRKVAPERGSAEFYALQTKAAAGTIALATFAMMLASAFKDRREKKEPFFELHGPGPKDPKMRAQWVGAGHKPFSMRIGEVELRFTDWPGINIPLGMLGTIYDNAVYGDREADLLDQLFTGLAAVMGTTLDRNMLGGASAVFDILSKNTYDGAKQAALGKFASSYVGGFLKPSDIRYFETIATGGYQDTRGLSGWFKSQIPFVGATNGNPALNVLGEPIKVSAWDATAGRLVSLSNTHPILSPLTTAELLIPEPKAYKISDPSSPTRVRPMEAQELYDFTKIYGEAMRNRLTPEMVDGLVEQAKTAPQGAQDRLTKIAESVRNQAQGELMRAREIRKGKEYKGP